MAPKASNPDLQTLRAYQIKKMWKHLDALGTNRTSLQSQALASLEQYEQLRSKLEMLLTTPNHALVSEAWPAKWVSNPRSLRAQLGWISKWSNQRAEQVLEDTARQFDFYLDDQETPSPVLSDSPKSGGSKDSRRQKEAAKSTTPPTPVSNEMPMSIKATKKAAKAARELELDMIYAATDKNLGPREKPTNVATKGKKATKPAKPIKSSDGTVRHPLQLTQGRRNARPAAPCKQVDDAQVQYPSLPAQGRRNARPATPGHQGDAELEVSSRPVVPTARPCTRAGGQPVDTGGRRTLLGRLISTVLG
ncbi:hypothetical protein QBC39DRAFT_358187, partial [Podospora conica]